MTKQGLLTLALEKYQSKSALATAIGVNRSHISNIFAGRDNISRDIATFLANALTDKIDLRNHYFYIFMHE